MDTFQGAIPKPDVVDATFTTKYPQSPSLKDFANHVDRAHGDGTHWTYLSTKKNACLKLPFLLYAAVGVVVCTSISGFVNGFLAGKMYWPGAYDTDTNMLRAFPNTLAGDIVVTTLVQTLITFAISSSLAMADAANERPWYISGVWKWRWEWFPKEHALFGPYFAKDGPNDLDAYAESFLERLIGTIRGALVLAAWSVLLFGVPTILLGVIIVEVVMGKSDWSQNQIIWLKAVAFAVLGFVQQFLITWRGLTQDNTVAQAFLAESEVLSDAHCVP